MSNLLVHTITRRIELLVENPQPLSILLTRIVLVTNKEVGDVVQNFPDTKRFHMWGGGVCCGRRIIFTGRGHYLDRKSVCNKPIFIITVIIMDFC